MDVKAEQQIRDAVVARFEFDEGSPDPSTIGAIVGAAIEEIERSLKLLDAGITLTPDGLTAEGIELLRKCIFDRTASEGDLRLADVTLSALAQSLAHRKPFIGDEIRVERGEFVRSSGESTCTVCGQKIYDHPSVPNYRWLRRHCNGNLIKV